MGLVRGAAGMGPDPADPPGLAGAAGRADGGATVPGREASLPVFGALAGTQK